ncbi:MAG: DUF1622 domain-containing protein, partial [Acaryochloridaceae cyanobacterium SU_2_1]|nr:DUF1622 domain-containing protein [Acaryochloridaceae cyanobacterium SU_2_1]
VTKGRAIDKVFMNQNGIFHIFMMLYTASLQSNSDLCVHRSPTAFQSSRLEMGYSFSLGLSFLVGATILKTMLSSQWLDIARLAIIIGVRTILNLLLERAISRSVRGDDVVEYTDHETILQVPANLSNQGTERSPA